MFRSILSVSVLTLSFAIPSARATTSSELVKALSASPAVTGAIAEAKKWSGAKTCGALKVEEIRENLFRATAFCNNPDVGAGQVEISGQILPDETSGTIHLMLSKIEFSFAG